MLEWCHNILKYNTNNFRCNISTCRWVLNPTFLEVITIYYLGKMGRNKTQSMMHHLQMKPKDILFPLIRSLLCIADVQRWLLEVIHWAKILFIPPSHLKTEDKFHFCFVPPHFKFADVSVGKCPAYELLFMFLYLFLQWPNCSSSTDAAFNDTQIIGIFENL